MVLYLRLEVEVRTRESRENHKPLPIPGMKIMMRFELQQLKTLLRA